MGEVACTAINSEGEATSKARLEVTRRPQRPVFDKKLQNATVERGQKAVFEAHADASPAAEYMWSIDNQRVWNSTPGTSIETDLSTGTTRLIIDTSIMPNPATVVVSAENKLGSDQCFALLQVNEPTTRVLEEKMHGIGQETVNMSEADELQRRFADDKLGEHADSRTQGTIEMDKIQAGSKGEPPQITQAPNPRTVSEHEVVQFSATVSTKLRPLTVEWSVNGQVIHPTSTDFGLSQSGDQYTLRVNDSNVNQTGEIKVIATNPAGSTSATANLQVNKKTKPIPTFTTKLPSDLKAKEGEPFQVSIKAPNADSIEWTLNGKPLQVN